MRALLPFDDNPDFYSNHIVDIERPDSRDSMRALIKEADRLFHRWFSMLPEVDYEIAQLYYVEDQSQNNIANLLGITQAAVSRRIAKMRPRLRVIMRMPTSDPVRVRAELQRIFPEDLFEFAYFYYFEPSQNRVKYFIETSQSGAANKFKKVLSYLREIIASEPITDSEKERKLLALYYNDFFQSTKDRSAKLSYLYKSNDEERTTAVEPGPSIFLDKHQPGFLLCPETIAA